MNDLISFSILALAVILFIFIFLKQRKKRLLELERIKKNIYSNEEFEISHEFFNEYYSNGIALDDKNKKIMFLEYKGLFIIDYKDLISFQIKMNDSVLNETSRTSQAGGALIGGVLLGPIGFLAGALSGKSKSSKVVNKLSILCTLVNLDEPLYEIIFYNGKSLNINNYKIKKAVSLVDEWIAKLTIVTKYKN